MLSHLSIDINKNNCDTSSHSIVGSKELLPDALKKTFCLRGHLCVFHVPLL